MPIYKGNTQIVGIYKGNTEIVKRYKGSDLIYEAFAWLPYSYEYLYNSLIPTTIDSKTVKDKLRLNKIYANGVIENQLNTFADFSSGTTVNVNEVAYLSAIVSDNKLTLTLLQGINSGTTSTIHNGLSYPISHKALVFGTIKSVVGTNKVRLGFDAMNDVNRFFDTTVNENTTVLAVGLIETYTSTRTGFTARIQGQHPAGNSVEITKLCAVDLTLMFGTGNEPTSLSDNRIQALLNRGYIEYNAGSYKGTDIGEFSSEPYNLLSLDRTAGTLSGGGNTAQRLFEEDKYYIGLTRNNYYQPVKISNFLLDNNQIQFTTSSSGYGVAFPVKCLPNTQYTIQCSAISSLSTVFTGLGISYYDKDGTIINYETQEDAVQNKSKTITTPTNAYWICVVLYGSSDSPLNTFSNICVHRTGIRTDYAPYKSLSPLPFKYQGNGAMNAHDTLEITNTEWVFTKNVGVVDLATLTYGTSYTDVFSVSQMQNVVAKPSTYAIKPNAICPKYQTTYADNLAGHNIDKAISITPAGYIWIRDTSYSSTSDFKTAMSGVMLYYQLATPQVIRIPRKHLAVVKISDLSWTYSSTTFRFASNISSAKPTANNETLANIYCSPFMTKTYSQTLNENLSIGLDRVSYCYIKDTSISTITDFLNKYGNYYIFYETQDEVADIDTTMQVEVGGTISTDSFEWVENQLVSNGNFETNASGWGALQGTNSVSDNTLTFTATNTAVNTGCYTQVIANGTTANHKYLITAKIKSSVSTTTTRIVFDGIYTDNPVFPLTANTWLDFNRIFNVSTPNTTSGVKGYLYFYYSQSGEQVASGSTLSVKKVMCIDLTLAFGAGNEPTDVSDPRIQAILNKGYIAYDATGTTTYETSEVLPNLDALIKCK